MQNGILDHTKREWPRLNCAANGTPHGQFLVHLNRILSLITISLIAITLSACTHTPVAVCPPLKDYPPEFNARLADELEPLPADSATIQAIQDYIALRDAVRACQ